MPQIPVYSGSQRLEPGSPVQVGSASDTAGQAAAKTGEAFGQALFQFGNMLDQAGRTAKDNTDKLNVKIALNELEDRAIELSAAQKAAGIADDDPTGINATKDFRQKLYDAKAEIATRFADPKVGALFEAESGSISKHYQTTVLAEEVQKREKNVPIKRQEYLSSLMQKAYRNPMNSDVQALEAEAAIIQSTDIVDAIKPAEVLKAKQAVYRKAIDGKLDTAVSSVTPEQAKQQFNDARQILNTKLNYMLTPEEYDAERTRLNKAEQDYFLNAKQEAELKDRMAERHEKDVATTAYNGYMQQLATVKNDDTKVKAILQEVNADPSFNAFPERRKELQGMTVFKELADDTYESKVVYDVISGKSTVQKANDKINRDLTKGLVSTDRANKLMKSLDDLVKNDRPNLSNVIKAGENAIKVRYGATTTIDPKTGEVKEIISQAGANAVLRYQERISALLRTNPNANEASVVSIAKSFNPAIGLTNDPYNSPLNTNTQKGIKESAPALIYEYQKPGTTPQRKQQIKQQLEILKKNKAVIDFNDAAKLKLPAQPTNTNPSYFNK